MDKKTNTQEYLRVKERVKIEKEALPRIVIETGVGMLVGLLAAIFLFR